MLLVLTWLCSTCRQRFLKEKKMNNQCAMRLVGFASQGVPVAGPSTRGPTSTSNWVIPGLVLWGDVPRGPKLAALVDSGITHFLDLRGSTAVEYANRSPGNATVHRRMHMSQYLTSNTSNAITECALALKGVLGEVLSHPNGILYVHCEDGHTLSCIAACGILSFVFGITGMKATAVAAQLHASRSDSQGTQQLLNAQQKAFVRDLAKDTNAMDPMFLTQLGDSDSKAFCSDTNLSIVAASVNQSIASAETPRRISRFDHSKGTSGGGQTTINLFGPCSSATDDESPHKRGRAFVPSPHGKSIAAMELASIKALGQSSSQALSQCSLCGTQSERISPVMTPMSGSAAASGTSPTQQQQQRLPSVNSLDSPPQSSRSLPRSERTPPDSQSTMVCHMQRPTLAHAWGLILDGCLVQHVLPNSPAEHGGMLPGMRIRSVDNGEFSPHHNFDWVTHDRLSVSVTVTAGGISSSRCDAIEPPVLSTPPPLDCYNRSESRASEVAAPTVVRALALEDIPRMFDVRAEKGLIRGPFAQSNWVVKGLILCGPVPDPRRKKEFDAICGAEIDIFVSLLENDGAVSIYLPAYQQRSLPPKPNATCVRFPLEDGCPLPPSSFDALTQLARSILQWSVGERKRVYIHCKNGHGRTGLLVSCIVALAYHLPGMKAVNYCDSLHSCRDDTEDQSSPQTQEQRLSAISLISSLSKLKV